MLDILIIQDLYYILENLRHITLPDIKDLVVKILILLGTKNHTWEEVIPLVRRQYS